MSAVRTDLDRSCWTAEYLLGHCEGYRVESSDGTLGYVEEVVWARDRSEPIAARVRTGFGDKAVVTLMIEDVLELYPNDERIVVRVQTGSAVPLETNGHSPQARITKRNSSSVLKLAVR